MAQNQNNNRGKGNPQLRQRLQREHHEAHKAHREEREQGERERFTQGPTPSQARHQAGAYANKEYAPVIRGIREEGAQLAAQQKQSSQWYNQLAEQQTQGAQAALGAANSFSSTLTQQLQNANNTNAAYLASQQQAQAQNAALTGIPTQPGEGSAAAAGTNIGNLENVALTAPIIGSAYNQAQYDRSLGQNTGVRGHEVTQGLQGERKKVRQDLRAAQKQKGQAYVGRLAEERESARKAELDKAAFALEGQQAQAQQAAEQQKIQQDEVQNKRQAQTTRRGQNTTAASSAASTAASVEGNQTSKRTARIAEEKLREEQQFKRNHGGRTPAEVSATKKEGQRNPLEKREKSEEAKTAVQTAHRVYNLLKNSKEFKTLTPAEQWALLEEAVAKRGVEGPLVAKAVSRIKSEVAPVKVAENINPF